MKNPIQFFYLLLLSLFTFLSCDQDNEDTDSTCDAINALEIVASLNEVQQTDIKAPYTFTINNTSLSNLAFEWYIDGQLQENSNDNSSLFNFDFIENGTYEICLQPLATNNVDCELKKVCTSLTFENFPETPNTCDLLKLDHLTPNIGNPIIVEKSKGLSFDGVAARFRLIGAYVEQFKIFVDEENSNFEKVIDENPATIFDQSTFLVPFTKVGIYNIKVVAKVRDCDDEQIFYAKVAVNSNFQARITLLNREQNIEETETETEPFSCFDSEFNVFHSQRSKESYFGFSPYLYSPADDISYTWFLDGAELSHDERIQLSGRSFVLQFSSIMKLCNGQHTVSVNVISPTVCPNGTTYTKTFDVDYNVKDCSGSEITPQNEPEILTCNNIDFTARVQPHFDGATFHASYIGDATYTWFVNGNEIPESQLPSSNRQGVSEQVKGALKTLQFFELGTGTHTVKVTIVSPSICPNGTTLSQTVTLP